MPGMGADTLDYCGIIPKDLATGALWPQIGALIAAAMPYGRGEYDLDDIRAGIDRNEMFAVGCVNARAEVEFEDAGAAIADQELGVVRRARAGPPCGPGRS